MTYKTILPSLTALVIAATSSMIAVDGFAPLIGGLYRMCLNVEGVRP